VKELKINPDFVPIKDFAKIIGLSRQRLYELWKAGRGPTRIDTGFSGARGGPRYLVNLKEGLLWYRKRRASMSSDQRAAGKRSREWWAARNRTKQRARDVTQRPGEPERPAEPSQIARSSVSPSVGEGQSEGTEARAGKPFILRKSQCEGVLRKARHDARHDCIAEGMLTLMEAAGATTAELTLR